MGAAMGTVTITSPRAGCIAAIYRVSDRLGIPVIDVEIVHPYDDRPPRLVVMVPAADVGSFRAGLAAVEHPADPR